MKKKFEKFLKDNRLYAAFIRNLNNSDCNGWCVDNKPHRCLGRKSAMNHYLDSTKSEYNWVGSGFIWSDTPEGMRWCDLDREWEEACHE